MEIDIRRLTVQKDERGFLFEIIKKRDLGDKGFGQILLTAAKEGVEKGGHYHLRKNEWFCVIKGEGVLNLQDINTKEVKEISIEENAPVIVHIPPRIAHAIKNVGRGDLYLLVCTDEEFDPKDADTFPIVITQ